MNEINPIQWKVNYLWRVKTLADKELSVYTSQKIQPEYKEREVRRITLKEYIEFVGIEPAAELFGCSAASTKAWRYGIRQPSIKQAKKLFTPLAGDWILNLSLDL